MFARRCYSTSRSLVSRTLGGGIAAIGFILVASPAHAAGCFVESTEHLRGQDYGQEASNCHDEWTRDEPLQGSNFMTRTKEMTREVSSVDSRWGVSGTYKVPRGSSSFSATFTWGVRVAEALVLGGTPVTTDAGGPNSTELKLVATSPGCPKCKVFTGVTDVVKADSLVPYQKIGPIWPWGESREYPARYQASVTVTAPSGSLPSTLELRTFFSSRSRLGGVGQVDLYFSAAYERWLNPVMYSG